jgi:hypothetical protein
MLGGSTAAHDLLTEKPSKMGQNEVKSEDPHQAKSPSTLGQQAFQEKFDKLTAEREGVEPGSPTPHL